MKREDARVLTRHGLAVQQYPAAGPAAGPAARAICMSQMSTLCVHGTIARWSLSVALPAVDVTASLGTMSQTLHEAKLESQTSGVTMREMARSRNDRS